MAGAEQTTKQLQLKTLPQLQEMLQSQRSLLNKPKLLQTLPDRGAKVQHLVQTLEGLITERQGSHAAATSTSSLPSQPASGHNLGGRRPPVKMKGPALDDGTGDRETDMDLTHRLSHLTMSQSEHSDCGLPAYDCEAEAYCSLPLLADESDILASGASVPRPKTHYTNSYENVINRQASAVGKKAPFKPNSSLKLSSVHELPENVKNSRPASRANESVDPSKPEQTKKPGSSSKPAKAESAAQPPNYKFKQALELPLEDSISLQKQQEDQTKAAQMSQAAQRLEERLHIKTSDYLPLTIDMGYRESGPRPLGDGNVSDIDSDDFPEGLDEESGDML